MRATKTIIHNSLQFKCIEKYENCKGEKAQQNYLNPKTMPSSSRTFDT